jgi:septum formation topological specificity factor MinE
MVPVLSKYVAVEARVKVSCEGKEAVAVKSQLRIGAGRQNAPTL